MNKVKLPDTRLTGRTVKVKIGDLSVFIIVNKDEHGNVMECFAYERKGHQGELDGLAGLASIALQHGTPIEKVVEFLRYRRYAPEGGIGQPSSLSDALGRALEQADNEDWTDMERGI